MLLSRVADSLYWIGRYLERAERMARLIDVRLDLGLDRRANGWNFSRFFAIARVDVPSNPPESPPSLVDALMFGSMIAMLLLRPQGLFGRGVRV